MRARARFRFPFLPIASIVALLLAVACSDVQSRFAAYDVYVDSGDAPLAAYQIDVLCPNADLVGIEGGDPEQFSEPPHYDPRALQGRRVVLAALTTDPDAPSGRVRVARLHVLQHAALFTYETRDVTVARVGGERIPAAIEILPAEETR